MKYSQLGKLLSSYIAVIITVSICIGMLSTLFAFADTNSNHESTDALSPSSTAPSPSSEEASEEKLSPLVSGDTPAENDSDDPAPLTSPATDSNAENNASEQSSAAEDTTDADTVQDPQAAYDAQFQIPTSAIARYTSNYGNWWKNVIAYAFDGNPATFWETRLPNDATRTNHVDITFKEITAIGKIEYYPRADGTPLKGYPTQLTILASQSDKGENFTEIYSAKNKATSEALNIDLGKNYSFKRLRFRFDEADRGMAAIGELKFYKFDELAAQVKALFADGLYSSLKAGITKEHLDTLEAQVASHPSDAVKNLFQRARDVLAGSASSEGEVFTLDQRGNTVKHARDVLKTGSYGTDLLPVGIAARAGETIRVYVDADTSAPLPQIAFSQQFGKWNGWITYRNLHVGENIFTVPHLPNPSNVPAAGGAVYFLNPYTAQEQLKAPRIRIENGYRYPLFHDGDNVQDFMQFLRSYQEQMKKDPGKYANIVEILDDYSLVNGTMNNAQAWLNDQASPQDAVNLQKKTIPLILAYAGITEENGTPTSSRMGVRAHMRAMSMPNASYGAYAMGDHVGYREPAVGSIFAGKPYNWALTHELGHQLDIPGGTWAEITNNVWANYIQTDVNKGTDRAEAYGWYNNAFIHSAPDSYATQKDVPWRTNALWQLRLLKDNYWPEYQKALRNGKYADAGLTQPERIAAVSSAVMGMDLTEHFARYDWFGRRNNKGIATEEGIAKEAASIAKIKAVLAKDDVPEKEENIKPWYLWSKASKNAGKKFNNLHAPEIDDITYRDGKLTVVFKKDSDREDAALGYEIKMDGKVIGFTRTNTFTTAIADDKAEHNFSFRGFDINLTPTKALETVNMALSAPTSQPAPFVQTNPIQDGEKNCANKTVSRFQETYTFIYERNKEDNAWVRTTNPEISRKDIPARPMNDSEIQECIIQEEKPAPPAAEDKPDQSPDGKTEPPSKDDKPQLPDDKTEPPTDKDQTEPPAAEDKPDQSPDGKTEPPSENNKPAQPSDDNKAPSSSNANEYEHISASNDAHAEALQSSSTDVMPSPNKPLPNSGSRGILPLALACVLCAAGTICIRKYQTLQL